MSLFSLSRAGFLGLLSYFSSQHNNTARAGFSRLVNRLVSNVRTFQTWESFQTLRTCIHVPVVGFLILLQIEVPAAASGTHCDFLPEFVYHEVGNWEDFLPGVFRRVLRPGVLHVEVMRVDPRYIVVHTAIQVRSGSIVLQCLLPRSTDTRTTSSCLRHAITRQINL